MSDSFSPYQAWLGLAPELTDPNYFELLGLDPTEEDPKSIAAAADRAASRVRRHRPGEHAAEWAGLLDQIAAAKKCLTDAQQRSEYLTHLGKKSASSKPVARRTEETVSTSNPNLYPPSKSSGKPKPQSSAAEAKATKGTWNKRESLAQQSPSDPYAIDPQAPLPMQPVATPFGTSTHPAGVPYLQAADSSADDPMASAVPAMSPYVPHSPMLDPMAPAMPAMASPMSPYSAASHPMAAIPVAVPLAENDLPMAQAVPLQAGTYATAQAMSPILNAAQPDAPAPAVSQTSAAILIAERKQRRGYGAAFIGLSLAGLALAVLCGVLYFNSKTNQSEQVAVTDGSTSGDPAKSPAVPAALPSTDDPPASERSETKSELKTDPINDAAESPTDPAPLPDLTKRKNDDKSAEMTAPAPANPEPTSTPTKPTDAPQPTTTPTPTPTPTPTDSDDLPKPTKEELTKLGRAMQKARDAVKLHEFDKAAAFVELASELPRLPEHQAMLDRLKLLSESVKQYKTAIQTSIGNLASGSSFQVGEASVGVVETSPEKVIFRVNGQNRTYALIDLPVGLAAALASQTLPPDDPKTQMLKGAYVLSSPKASDEDLKKAREFLESAAASLDEAKELLPILDDKYDLAAKEQQ